MNDKRPAFHVDKKLKKAASKAVEAFEAERCWHEWHWVGMHEELPSGPELFLSAHVRAYTYHTSASGEHIDDFVMELIETACHEAIESVRPDSHLAGLITSEGNFIDLNRLFDAKVDLFFNNTYDKEN